MLYLCTQSIAPIVERKILSRKVLYFKTKWSVYERRRSIYLRMLCVCEHRHTICYRLLFTHEHRCTICCGMLFTCEHRRVISYRMLYAHERRHSMSHGTHRTHRNIRDPLIFCAFLDFCVQSMVKMAAAQASIAVPPAGK